MIYKVIYIIFNFFLISVGLLPQNNNSLSLEKSEQRPEEKSPEKKQINLNETEETNAGQIPQKPISKNEKSNYQFKQDSLLPVINDTVEQLIEVRNLDSIRRKEIEFLKTQREYQETQLRKKEAGERIARLIILSVSLGLILVIVIAVIAYRGYRYQQQLNIELETKNQEIKSKNSQLQDAYKQMETQNINFTKSINYAREIQKALFPRQELLNTFIPESFILFKPRDIVSGDFYWFSEIDKRKDLYDNNPDYPKKQADKIFEHFRFLPIENHKFVIAAVDCTGHGVPGGFMSMIGYNLLDEIIGSGISRADLILNELHKGVRRILKQEISENRDGMDLAVCIINNLERTVNFAGAESPLLYIKNDKINYIKGDRNSIGGLQTEKTRAFTGHTIKVEEPTWFYIFSDGFIDQFGGPKGRKYLLNNLKDQLLRIHRKPMIQQKVILENTYKEWINENYKQVDDILVIGFKLG